MFPTRAENPNGLHQRYIVSKADGSPVTGTYLVLRIDNNGNDQEWIRCCKKAAGVLASEIKFSPRARHLYKIADDLDAYLQKDK